MVGEAVNMDWEILLDKDVQNFIFEHEGDDVVKLALKKSPNKNWDYPVILDQIKVRQKAAAKTPKLCDTKGFVFPAPFLYEQASSEACAAYKSRIARGFGDVFADLTAGVGVDSFALAKIFSKGVLVEKNSRNAAILSHNANLVEKEAKAKLDVIEDDAEAYVSKMLAASQKVSLVYIDPQRREDLGGKKGLYDFDKCSPDIIGLLPKLVEISKAVLIKASPFMDIDRALGQLGECLKEPCRIDVHVVGWHGDCKEVLYLLDFSSTADEKGARITAVELDDDGGIRHSFSFYKEDEHNAQAMYAMPRVGDYIYEPGAAFLKSGGFKCMSQHFSIKKLHSNTHLYVCKMQIKDFPGKKYKIKGLFPSKPGVIPTKNVDLAVRNFPQSVVQLKKKLKLRDGGDHRVYATTTYDDKHCLILCEKLYT